MKDFNSTEYKRSRNAYTIQCAVEYFVDLLVADAFLAKLLSHIGMSDAMVGIISSFITLAFIFQLFSIFLVKSKMSTKKQVMTIDIASVFFFMLMYCVPFFPIAKSAKIALAALFIILAYAAKYLVLSIYYKWGNSFVMPEKRAVFSAKKEVISLISGMIFTAIMGKVIDGYESVGNLEGGFLFSAVAILILNICNFVCLSMIKKEDSEEREAEQVPLGEVVRSIMGNKSFRNVILLTILWNVGAYFTIGFLGVFKTNDLLMSVFLIQVINIIGAFARAVVSAPLGKYSDKTSYAKGMKLGLYIAAAAFFANMFTTPATWYMIIVYTILYNCSQAAISQNSFLITYSYVEEKYIPQAMAIKNSIGGICGFLASLLGGRIVTLVQENGNSVFGIEMYAQQLLSAISLVILVCAIIFSKTVIEKQKVMRQ